MVTQATSPDSDCWTKVSSLLLIFLVLVLGVFHVSLAHLLDKARARKRLQSRLLYT